MLQVTGIRKLVHWIMDAKRALTGKVEDILTKLLGLLIKPVSGWLGKVNPGGKLDPEDGSKMLTTPVELSCCSGRFAWLGTLNNEVNVYISGSRGKKVLRMKGKVPGLVMKGKVIAKADKDAASKSGLTNSRRWLPERRTL